MDGQDGFTGPSQYPNRVARIHDGWNGDRSVGRHVVKIIKMGRGGKRRARIEGAERPRVDRVFVRLD